MGANETPDTWTDPQSHVDADPINAEPIEESEDDTSDDAPDAPAQR